MAAQQSKNTIKHAQSEAKRMRHIPHDLFAEEVDDYSLSANHDTISIVIPTFYNIDEIDL